MNPATLLTIFVTGLTGGLTCLAVQGGLLATAVAKQVPVTVTRRVHKKGENRATHQEITQTSIRLPANAWPVAYFLIAKLVAYTLLGLLLGAVGAAIRITPTIQAITLTIAALFMLATALNMLNVHPIFRYAVIQPPRFLTRLIKDQSRSQDVFAPVLLGAMTVFIPCGVTQAMEVQAINSNFPIYGAATMFVFTLGTMPTFFALGFTPTLLKAKARSVFALIAAFLVLGIGLYTLDNALKLANSPFVPSRAVASLFQPDLSGAAKPKIVDGVQELTINVLPRAYTPNLLTAQANEPLRLQMVTNNTNGCTRSFTIPALGIAQVLPQTGRVAIDLPAQPPGNLYFTCGMGMYSGVIVIQ